MPGLIKIGSTADQRNRQRNAKTWLPNLKMECYSFKEADGILYSSVETRLHRLLEEDRVDGEWYRVDLFDLRQLLLELYPSLKGYYGRRLNSTIS